MTSIKHLMSDSSYNDASLEKAGTSCPWLILFSICSTTNVMVVIWINIWFLQLIVNQLKTYQCSFKCYRHCLCGLHTWIFLSNDMRLRFLKLMMLKEEFQKPRSSETENNLDCVNFSLWDSFSHFFRLSSSWSCV